MQSHSVIDMSSISMNQGSHINGPSCILFCIIFTALQIEILRMHVLADEIQTFRIYIFEIFLSKIRLNLYSLYTDVCCEREPCIGAPATRAIRSSWERGVRPMTSGFAQGGVGYLAFCVDSDAASEICCDSPVDIFL